MNENRIIYILLISIAIVSAIIIAVTGLNVDFKYSEHKQIQVYIGKEFNNDDIIALVKEVIGNKEVVVQKVETYEEIVQISVKDISDEEIAELNNKINEKYSLENTVDDIIVNEIPKIRLRDMIRPYVLPVGISLAIILIYAGIRFRKIEITEVLTKIIAYNIFAQLEYIAVLAIIRLPINVLTIPTAITIYAIITLIIFSRFEIRESKIDIEKKKKK